MPASTRRKKADQNPSAMQGKTEMRKRGKAGPEQKDAAHRHAVGERDQDRDHDDIGREEDANEPTGFGCRQRPALDVAGQQRRKPKAPSCASICASTIARV